MNEYRSHRSLDATPDTAPVPLDPSSEAALDDKCVLRSEIEILFVLRSIQRHDSIVAVYTHDGDSHALTSILDIDAKHRRVVFERGPDSELNRQLLAAERTTFVTSLDHIKVQFESGRVQEVKHDGASAFAAEMPSSVVRIQRREYYRISTPANNPPVCLVTVGDAGAARTVEIPILDLSCGGVGLDDRGHGVSLEPGSVLDRCRIALPTVDLVVTLRVMNAHPVTLPDGRKCTRAGCEFVRLPEYHLTAIQRYVIELERARNARMLGIR
jgi:c-di-GMP-binding flagellar brake protein YcgR